MQRADELLRQMTAKTEVSVGSSSSDSKSTATFTVTGKTRVGRGEERAFLSIAGVS